MRASLIVGNWKMHGLASDAVLLATAIERGLAETAGPEVAICPPFTSLSAVQDALVDKRLALGAQNVHHEREGAFTGEISAGMLRQFGCRFVIVGHSERRRDGESDSLVRKKAFAALDAGLIPIVCVGETLTERDAGRTLEVIHGQFEGSLGGLRAAPDAIVVAYEPVWAIGTGRTASVAQARQAHEALRARAERLFGASYAESLRILYGGSVKPDNAANLFSEPHIDGGLIGGAALDANDFIAITRASPLLSG